MTWAFLEAWRSILRLSAVASGDRHQVTARVRQAFDDAGAWITDVHFFSGLQTTLSFEIAPGRITALAEALAKAGAKLDDESQSVLASAARAPVESLEGTLALIFREGDSSVRHEVPRVPG